MSDTTFTNGVTLTDDDWFNDVNDFFYTTFAEPANLAAVRTTLAASDSAAGTLEIAVQSEMEAGSSATLAVTPGRQHFHPSACKAHGNVTFSGSTPTLVQNYNVTSITDSGVGQTTITIATDFSSANYTSWACLNTGASNAHAATHTFAAGTFIVRTFTNDAVTIADADVNFSFGALGDQ